MKEKVLGEVLREEIKDACDFYKADAPAMLRYHSTMANYMREHGYTQTDVGHTVEKYEQWAVFWAQELLK